MNYELAFGSYEDAQKMIGVRTEPRCAGTAVSVARIQHFAALVRDGNPAYWDNDFAVRVWGGAAVDSLRKRSSLVAPPALLMGLLIPPPWLPSGRPRVASIALRVPLPGTTFINAANEAEFPVPIREGDQLSVVEEVASVSPEKTTQLGAGHFVETSETYHREDGTVVATSRNTLFRFTPGDRS